MTSDVADAATRPSRAGAGPRSLPHPRGRRPPPGCTARHTAARTVVVAVLATAVLGVAVPAFVPSVHARPLAPAPRGSTRPADATPTPAESVAARSPGIGAVGDTGAIRLDSRAATYPLVGALSGRVRDSGDTLLVDLAPGMVRNQLGPALGPSATLHDVAIAVGVGRDDGDGWAVDRVSRDTVTLAAALGPGDTVITPAHQFAIPLPRTVGRADRWVFAQLVASHAGLFGRPPGRLAAYVCSEGNLAGGEVTSAARVARMRRRYSLGC